MRSQIAALRIEAAMLKKASMLQKATMAEPLIEKLIDLLDRMASELVVLRERIDIMEVKQCQER